MMDKYFKVSNMLFFVNSNFIFLKKNKRAILAKMALDRSSESFSPQMNLCTNLVEVHKEMLRSQKKVRKSVLLKKFVSDLSVSFCVT